MWVVLYTNLEYYFELYFVMLEVGTLDTKLESYFIYFL